jgi:hypothetical protein
VAACIGDDPRTVLATYAHLLPSTDALAAQAIIAAIADTALTNAPETPALQGVSQ